MEFRDLLLGLVLVWLAAKAAGEALERIGQTAVLGELLAGVLIGPGVLGLVHDSEVLHALAELGVLILLFEVGLESDPGELLRAGPQATLVALVGVAAPFAAGYGVMTGLGHSALVAVFVGATLTATSVGITARVLRDLGRLQDPAAKVVLGAAVVDDVLGLIILAVVTGVAQTGGVSMGAIGLLSGKAFGFLLVAIVVGIRLAPALVRWIGRLQARGTLIVYSVVFAVALAAVADLMGLATIIGAFAAGLILATTERRAHIEERIKPVADLLVPVFFVTVGMKVEPAMLNPFAAGSQFGIAALITVVAVASKLAAGLAVYQRGVRRWPVAVGMVPRGEVGLIFAGAGLSAGVIAGDLYSALIVVVMATTFAAPPWLKALYRGGEKPP
ncbi:MAG TPA: cation:proton antiporter [Methylomirabilota bacterium]|jgi:Kef-type K+ transport system membrane component KefB|nr:cation:proton antiporter [Methylomirabilota bacterium]